ncbi:hypothetical protein D3C81_1377620 [compost metagenome]
MRKPRRRQANLRIAEALVHLAQHLAVWDAQVIDHDQRMSAGHGTVDGVDQALDADGRVWQIDEEHRGLRTLAISGTGHHDAHGCAFRTGDEFLAAANHPFVAIPHRRGLEHRRVRTGAAVLRGLGHEECGTRLAADQRRQESLLLRGSGHLSQQEHVAFVGRHRIDGNRAER